MVHTSRSHDRKTAHHGRDRTSPKEHGEADSIHGFRDDRARVRRPEPNDDDRADVQPERQLDADDRVRDRSVELHVRVGVSAGLERRPRSDLRLCVREVRRSGQAGAASQTAVRPEEGRLRVPRRMTHLPGHERDVLQRVPGTSVPQVLGLGKIDRARRFIRASGEAADPTFAHPRGSLADAGRFQSATPVGATRPNTRACMASCCFTSTGSRSAWRR